MKALKMNEERYIINYTPVKRCRGEWLQPCGYSSTRQARTSMPGSGLAARIAALEVTQLALQANNKELNEEVYFLKKPLLGFAVVVGWMVTDCSVPGWVALPASNQAVARDVARVHVSGS
jgi:hypothetical protein